MSDSWEYMQIVWAYTGSGVEEAFFISQPGKGSDKRDASDLHINELLNEFGAQGWELVTETVLESVVMEHKGWGPAGMPKRERWTLKRWTGQTGP